MRTVMQIIASSPEQLVRIFGIDQLPPSMIDTIHQLASDVRQLQIEGRPTDEDLAAAPLIENWSPALSPLGIVLIGEVTDHPTCRGPIVRTTPIWIIDHQLGWARSLNRYYRLGTAAALAANSAN